MSRLKLPKKIILRKKKDFNEVFSKGTTIASKYFLAFFLPARDLKVGFTTQKGLRTKVQRNRLKRRLRELWRTNFREHDLSGRIVLLIRVNAERIKFAELQDDFKILLKKLDDLSRKEISVWSFVSPKLFLRAFPGYSFYPFACIRFSFLRSFRTVANITPRALTIPFRPFKSMGFSRVWSKRYGEYCAAIPFRMAGTIPSRNQTFKLRFQWT